MPDETGSIREALRHDPAKRNRVDPMPMLAVGTGDRRKTVGALSRKAGVTPGDLDSAPGLRTGQERMQAGENAMPIMLHEPA
ncbi:hypothetical protein M2324_002496 [Rhodovulum sulfidophilum]|uniref:hypothetical protein n=1 Tax=Rhodovulum sulfidophilum TaxID=35806 RepID=UPI0005A60BDE|nr:hypothetical protein [Rhodovulum sulfidophilum]ANB33804.1 hypothetical protein A6W98_06755 [Rhodovulum sulfidophilum DSM 1374]ANB37626.1 hypothetical protein A6024_06610 [Rhodovulum sulfidophilum]MCW2304091.1 hypothetical protein [Rhodovulum sulfidophilum]